MNFDNHYVDSEVYRTDWERISPFERRKLVVTGRSAFEFLTGEELAQQDAIWAYADEEVDVPPGDRSQELRVLYVEEGKPSSLPYPGADVNIAEMDTLMEDFRQSNPREFQVKVEQDDEMLEMMRQNLSYDRRREFLLHFTGEEYRGDEVYDRIRRILPYYEDF